MTEREKQIDEVLSDLKELWTAHPQLRFGQLITNVFDSIELYFIYDNKFIDSMKKAYQKFDNYKK